MEKYVEGKCMDMCPMEETKMRQQQKLVHLLELSPETNKCDESKMVKSFARSAAGKSLQDPRNLRPPNVLLNTINYLLDDVLSDKNHSFIVKYNFIMDRLRAVRQDMVVQNTSMAHSICLLQPIIGFYAYSSYRSVTKPLKMEFIIKKTAQTFILRLCNETINNYDPHINNTHLQECLKRLLIMYDDYDKLYSDSDDFNAFLLKKRPQYESVYILLNLGNPTAIIRALSLSNKWMSAHGGLLRNTLHLSLSYANGNFVRVCKMLKKLPALLAAVTSLHLPQLRRNAFQVMAVAYSSKNMFFPVEIIQNLFLYNDEAETILDCKHYGLEVKENKVIFLKTSFKANQTLVRFFSQIFEDALNINSSDSTCAAQKSLRLQQNKLSEINNYTTGTVPKQYNNIAISAQPVVGKNISTEVLNGNQLTPQLLTNNQLTPQLLTNNQLKPQLLIGTQTVPQSLANTTTQSSAPASNFSMSSAGVLYTLRLIREPLVDYQDTRGLPRSEQITFVNLVTSLCTQAYTAAITIFVMLWNLIPLLEGFLVFIRFVLDKLIDILETPNTKDKAVKAAVFCGELVVVLIIVFLIIGLIVVPVYVLTSKLFGKMIGMIW